MRPTFFLINQETEQFDHLVLLFWQDIFMLFKQQERRVSPSCL